MSDNEDAYLAQHQALGEAYSSNLEQHSKILSPGQPSRRDTSQQRPNNSEASHRSTTCSPLQPLLQTPVHSSPQFLPQTPEQGSSSLVSFHLEVKTLRPPLLSPDQLSARNSPPMDIDTVLVDALYSKGSVTQKRERSPSHSTAVTPPWKASRQYGPNGEQMGSVSTPGEFNTHANVPGRFGSLPCKNRKQQGMGTKVPPNS